MPLLVGSLGWDIQKVAAGFCCDVETAKGLLSDARVINALVQSSLSQFDLVRVPDGASGSFHEDGEKARFRVRAAVGKLSFKPAKCEGAGRHFTEEAMAEEMAKLDGWLVIFSCDLPDPANVYLVDKEDAVRMRNLGLFNNEYVGNSGKIRRWLIEETSGK